MTQQEMPTLLQAAVICKERGHVELADALYGILGLTTEKAPLTETLVTSANSETANGWTPARRWYVLHADAHAYPSELSDDDPQIWCDTSDEDEARDALNNCPGGGKLFREYTRTELRLVEVPVVR